MFENLRRWKNDEKENLLKRKMSGQENVKTMVTR